MRTRCTSRFLESRRGFHVLDGRKPQKRSRITDHSSQTSQILPRARDSASYISNNATLAAPCSRDSFLPNLDVVGPAPPPQLFGGPDPVKPMGHPRASAGQTVRMAASPRYLQRKLARRDSHLLVAAEECRRRRAATWGRLPRGRRPACPGGTRSRSSRICRGRK